MATPGQEQLHELELYVEEPQQSTSTMKEDLLFSSTNRKFTDIWFFIVQGISIILSISLWMYCIAHSGIHDLPKKTTMEIISNDFSVYSTEIYILCFVAAVTSYMVLLLLRASTICFFYLLAIGDTVASITLLVVLWRHQAANNLFIMPAIAFTLATIGLVATVLINGKEIPHSMRMFEETGKYTGGASNLFYSSALTFVSVSIVWWCGIFFARSIESAGVQVGQGTETVLQQNFAIGCARWCNIIVTLWIVQFIYECQCLVLAGSISSCFFNRENTSSSSYAHSSAFFFLMYHLGTVSANSLVLMFVQFLHILFFLIRMMIFIPILRLLYRICLTGCFAEMTKLEVHLKFLIRSVSSLTAMYGYNFQKSIKNVGRFWKEDAAMPLRFPTIVGGIMLFVAKMFVVTVTVLISRLVIEIPSIRERNNQWNEVYLLGITALLAYLISNSILRVYEMSANVIVVCYCVDCHINNGTSRPYFMTASFMEFVETRRTFLEEEVRKELEKIIKQEIENTATDDTRYNELTTSRQKQHRHHRHHRNHRNRQQDV